MEPGWGLSQSCYQQISVRSGACARSKFLAHQQARDALEEVRPAGGHENELEARGARALARSGTLKKTGLIKVNAYHERSE